ncbi:Uncharacterized protein conserved in bacteria [Citrobacter freundii]|nr:Uncharacterized protein conserved in bacteria [Citrobacter freundii]
MGIAALCFWIHEWSHMNNKSLSLRSLFGIYIFFFTFISGCGSSLLSGTSRYHFQFLSHPEINGSAPLKIRVMVLRSDTEFMSADFYSLQNNWQKVLTGDLLNSDEFFLLPGRLSKQLNVQSIPEAGYIGVMAEYQSLDGKKWRVSLPLPLTSDIPFWQFWKRFAGQVQADFYFDVNGIRVVQQSS